jgi:hypothetical protein
MIMNNFEGLGLEPHHGNGGWRSLRWIADNLDAPPSVVERVLADMQDRPDEYGIRAERQLRDGKWRLVLS